MITRSKQKWEIGNVVNVGFLKLRITGRKAITDGKPDIYIMESIDGTKQYEFIPHNGLSRTN